MKNSKNPEEAAKGQKYFDDRKKFKKLAAETRDNAKFKDSFENKSLDALKTVLGSNPKVIESNRVYTNNNPELSTQSMTL